MVALAAKRRRVVRLYDFNLQGVWLEVVHPRGEELGKIFVWKICFSVIGVSVCIYVYVYKANIYIYIISMYICIYLENTQMVQSF